jgi:hypothetical protein
MTSPDLASANTIILTSKCPCCRHALPPSSFDAKKNGLPKATCRNCLLAFRSKYAAKNIPSTIRDAKKVRSDLMAAIFLTNDPQTLASILSFTVSAIGAQVNRLAESVEPLVIAAA